VSDADVGEPSYEELAALVVGLTAQLAAAQARIAELEAQVGKDSSNSSSPPSRDSPAAKGKRRAQRSQRVRSKDRKPGGQPGHAGSGLMPAAVPDRTETAEPAGQCSGCGGDLAEAVAAGMAWCQVWDIPAVRLETVHWWLPKRRCGCCRKTTTASVPFGQAGTVTYGLNVNPDTVRLQRSPDYDLTGTWRALAGPAGHPIVVGTVRRTGLGKQWEARTPELVAINGGPWRTRQDALIHLVQDRQQATARPLSKSRPLLSTNAPPRQS